MSYLNHKLTTLPYIPVNINSTCKYSIYQDHILVHQFLSKIGHNHYSDITRALGYISNLTVCSKTANNKEINKALHYWLLCGGNPPVTGGFPSQRASNTEAMSVSWRHPVIPFFHSNPVCTQSHSLQAYSIILALNMPCALIIPQGMLTLVGQNLFYET